MPNLLKNEPPFEMMRGLAAPKIYQEGERARIAAQVEAYLRSTMSGDVNPTFQTKGALLSALANSKGMSTEDYAIHIYENPTPAMEGFSYNPEGSEPPVEVSRGRSGPPPSLHSRTPSWWAPPEGHPPGFSGVITNQPSARRGIVRQ